MDHILRLAGFALVYGGLIGLTFAVLRRRRASSRLEIASGLGEDEEPRHAGSARSSYAIAAE